MNVLVRHTVLILFVWMMLAGVCLGKQVYLKDGGIIESESAWRQGDKVFVKVNRDIIADFNLNEVDLRRTFPKTGQASSPRHRKVAAVTAAPSDQVSAPVVPVPAVEPQSTPAVPQSKPAAPPPAPPAKEPLPPVAASTAPAEAVSPPKEQEAVKVITIPQQGDPMQAAGSLPFYVPLVFLAVLLLVIVAQWVLFTRAGQPGWKSLVPFYNMYILMIISGKPGWWMFLLFVPLVGVVIYLLSMLSLARRFSRSELFGVGMFLLPMIFFPVLAFGDSEYQG